MSNQAPESPGDFFDGLEQAKELAAAGRLGTARAGEGSAPAGAGDGWRVVTEVIDLLNSPIDRFDAVLEAVLDATIRLTGADRGFIMLYDEPNAPSSRSTYTLSKSSSAKGSSASQTGPPRSTSSRKRVHSSS